MRTCILAFFITGLTVTPTVAWAGHGGGGGGPPKILVGTLRITNQCDDAVAVRVNGGTPVTLEPAASTEQTFSLFKGSSTTASVQASLVSDPTVSAEAQCTVSAGKTTRVQITSSIGSNGQVVLSITSRTPGNASLSREARLLMCSSGGLGILLLLGTLLGRGPRKQWPQHIDASNDSSQ
jgi:uncharacterized protein YfaS (alpha-2-macroglobulin family)